MAEALESVTNPFQAMTGGGHASTALAHSDAQRAIAEVQAALVIARMNPRDPKQAMDLILQDCTRVSLAEKAVYAYARGGSDISGPSIRLAEVLAQRWGNIQYGVRELEQRDGESVVQAYAWDVESNTRREMTFTAAHVRDTKRGRVQLTEARDIYEATANQGARRVRACILGIIPGDVVEAALKQCEVTASAKADVTPDRVAQMLTFFGTFGVSKDMVEKRIQRRVDAITPALFLQLGKIANSLRDGMSNPQDWFEAGATPVREVQRKTTEPHPATEPFGPPAGALAIDASEPMAPVVIPAASVAAPAPTPAAVPAPALSKRDAAAMPRPDEIFHVAGVVKPNPSKDYVIVATTEGFVFHVWEEALQNEIQTAKIAGLGFRLKGELTTFGKAPFRATGIKPVFPSRDPGEEG